MKFYGPTRARSPSARGSRHPVGATLVVARRGNRKDTEPLGESVPPGGDPRGDRPSWAFPLGWVSGGEEIAIFPSRGSFLFGPFSLDKQRERRSSLSAFAEGIRKPRLYRTGGVKPRPYDRTETRACLRAAGLRALRVGGGPYGATGTFLVKFRTPNSELRIDRGRRPLRQNGTFLHHSELRTAQRQQSPPSASRPPPLAKGRLCCVRPMRLSFTMRSIPNLRTPNYSSL